MTNVILIFKLKNYEYLDLPVSKIIPTQSFRNCLNSFSVRLHAISDFLLIRIWNKEEE